MLDKFITVLIVVILVVTACTAGAQETETTTAPPVTSTDTTTSTAPTTTVAVTEIASSTEVRSELYNILRRLPPEVAKVLKLDPTLWSNATYMANYPTLQAFIAQHPEVAHNPRFFLEDVWLPNDPLPRTASLELWDNFIEVVTICFVVGAIALVLGWLIRTILNHRRWSRLARVQTEVHTKLLDRFSSNEELMAYINTTAGKRFLEAAPIAVQEPAPAQQQISAPINRVLWSMQAGLILVAAGVGMVVVSWIAEKDVASALSGFGILGIAVGIGFIASAAISLILSKRLGIWSAPGSMTDTAAE